LALNAAINNTNYKLLTEHHSHHSLQPTKVQADVIYACDNQQSLEKKTES